MVPPSILKTALRPTMKTRRNDATGRVRVRHLTAGVASTGEHERNIDTGRRIDRRDHDDARKRERKDGVASRETTTRAPASW
jgi:hypothetical protein